jgi:hypothetical protein
MADVFYMFYLYLVISVVIFIGIIFGIVAFFINRNRNINSMDQNQTQNQVRPKASAKDVLLNLGAFISLYILVGNLLGLLFTIINTAYPKITENYNYFGSSSISWPVATLVVLFPIFIILMWLLEKEYRVEPERQNSFAHKGLTYVTLFIAGLVLAGDLVTVVYYFIDGQELTTGFLLKVLVLFIIVSSIFIYFVSDLKGKLTKKSRIIWRFVAGVILVSSIVWGFSVLGSPRTQRLYKYDQQKVNDLQVIDNRITSFYSNKGYLPKNIDDIVSYENYYIAQVDSQNQKPYEYVKISDIKYNLCAEFNKASPDAAKSTNYTRPFEYTSWTHSAGHYCFDQTINPNTYSKPVPKMDY